MGKFKILMKKYEMLKVFDCTDMPENVLQKFYDDTRGIGNDVFIHFYVHDYQYKPEEYPEFTEILYKDETCGYVVKRGVDIVSDWLYDNGAKREKVIIKHWW